MRATEILQYLLPFFGAFIGVVVFIIERKEFWTKMRGGEAGPVLLILISLLCIAYGVERLTYSQQIEDRLDQIALLLQKAPSATFTDNARQIWPSISSMMLSLENNIRTVQAGDRPNIPEEFKELPSKIADRLLQMKHQHRDVFYRAVLVFDEKKTSQELTTVKEENYARLNFYASKGLKENVELRVFTRTPLTKFDVMIVDARDVSIGFDTLEGPIKGNVQIQNAMFWQNQPALAQKLAYWFDQSVWPNALPFDEWVKTQEAR